MVPQLSMGSRYKYPKSRLHQSPYRVSTDPMVPPRVACQPQHRASNAVATWQSLPLLLEFPACPITAPGAVGCCCLCAAAALSYPMAVVLQLTLCVMQHCHSAEAAVHFQWWSCCSLLLQFLCSCCFAVCSKMFLRYVAWLRSVTCRSAALSFIQRGCAWLVAAISAVVRCCMSYFLSVVAGLSCTVRDFTSPVVTASAMWARVFHLLKNGI
jgi:hypothetical protein